MKTMLLRNYVLRFFGALLLVAFSLAGTMFPVRAQATVDFDQHTMELNGLQVGIYCGVNGWGELVSLSGNVNVLFYTVENAGGGVLYRSKINGMHVTGVGQTTGATYHVTMISMGTSTLSDRQGYTSLTVANITGVGKNSKAVLQMVFHYGEDADGNGTVLVDHTTASCR